MLPERPSVEDLEAACSVGRNVVRRHRRLRVRTTDQFEPSEALLPLRQPAGRHPSAGGCTFRSGNGHADGVARQSCSIRITFCRPMSPDEYATAVLACQHALTMVGINDAATVWPDGTASDGQINEVLDRWLAGNPWAC